MDASILLENGTNESELLEFTLGGYRFGIFVEKVKEITAYQPVTPLPLANPKIEGVFMPRDKMLTVLDLRRCIGLTGEHGEEGFLILTGFDGLDLAFHVDTVVGISRVAVNDIVKPDGALSVGEECVAAGVVKVADRLVIILDFEKIITGISSETGLDFAEIEALYTE